MNALDILESAIGVIVVYLVLSLIATSLAEAWVQWRGLRGKFQRKAIRALLADDESLEDEFYKHAAVQALGSIKKPVKSETSKSTDPSYIQSRTFAEVVLDLVSQDQWRRSGTLPGVLRTQIARFGDSKQESKKKLAAILTKFLDESQGDLERFLQRIERWFRETNERATGWYRRAMNKIVFVVGLLIVLASNADTILIFNTLSHDESLREQAVALAVKRVQAAESTTMGEDKPKPEGVQSGNPTTTGENNQKPNKANTNQEKKSSEQDGGENGTLDQVKQELGAIQPFIGWSMNDPVVLSWPAKMECKPIILFVLTLLAKLLGLLFSALAISLGAPFWFELLQKLVRIRSSVKPETAATDKTQQQDGQQSIGSAAAEPTLKSAQAPWPSALPASTGNPSDEGYRAGLVGFVPHAGAFKRANAYWLATTAKLAYEDEAVVIDTCRGWGLEARFISGRSASLAVDTQLFIARDDQVILVVFRGTEPKQLSDIITDIRFSPVIPEWDGSSKDVTLHEGFRDALNAVWDKLCKTLTEFQTNQQSIWFGGHSLGGALALLGAYRLAEELRIKNDAVKKEIVKIDSELDEAKGVRKAELLGLRGQRAAELRGSIRGVYTIGQPRCGNEAFVKEAEQRLGGRIFRTINNRDGVPRVPLRAMGYQHAGQVFYFDEFGKPHEDPGLWYRLLDTLLVLPRDLKDKGTEVARDHDSQTYVALLARAAGIERSPVA